MIPFVEWIREKIYMKSTPKSLNQILTSIYAPDGRDLPDRIYGPLHKHTVDKEADEKVVPKRKPQKTKV